MLQKVAVLRLSEEMGWEKEWDSESNAHVCLLLQVTS